MALTKHDWPGVFEPLQISAASPVERPNAAADVQRACRGIQNKKKPGG
jgi:hypothetical protein